jgi:hypothetical protein
MIKKLLILILAASNLIAYAQERCGTEAINNYKMEKYANYRIAREKVNTQTENWIKENHNYSPKSIITIPVVVHVVWKTNIQNIADAQIQSQIDVLNKDYRRVNIDVINTPIVWQSVAADCEIEFCLATTDPNGQPTNGINRVQTNHGTFGMSSDIHTESLGGADNWPNDDYLNIWVCDIGSGLLGYASKPSNWISDSDGLVIGYKCFGTTGTAEAPYNKGRTATHEIGHWLNLDHVWGNGGWGSSGCNADDNIADTPNQEEENYDCPGFPHNANACGTSNGDMFMNYMDYTNDACMNLFTKGQKTRMISAINQYRSNMLSHNLCSGTTSIIYKEESNKELLKIVDFLGRSIKTPNKNTTYIYIYNDGSVEKKIVIN